MIAFITGITGSGGSYLAEYIVKHHPDVLVVGTGRWHTQYSQHNLKNVEEEVEVVSCDLTDFANVYRTLNKYRPEWIFHLASLANVKDAFSNTMSTYMNNVEITLNLLEAVRMLQDRYDYCPRIQLCSTSEVYGIVEPDEIPITENHPLKPVNPYACSKLAQDSLGYMYHKSFDLRVIRTRMFAYINPRRQDLFASSFARQIIRIERGETGTLRHGNLESVRTLIDVRDAMRAYWVAIQECEPGDVYNIGGTHEISVGDFLQLLISKASAPIPTLQDSRLMRPVDVTLQVPDCTKFMKQTNWKPQFSFEESVEFLLQETRTILS